MQLNQPNTGTCAAHVMGVSISDALLVKLAMAIVIFQCTFWENPSLTLT